MSPDGKTISIEVLCGAVADYAGEGTDSDYERRGDWRVTTTQAYKLFHALKDNGITVKFVAFPVPGHSRQTCCVQEMSGAGGRHGLHNI